MRRSTWAWLIAAGISLVGGIATLVFNPGERWVTVAGTSVFLSGWVMLFVAAAPTPRWPAVCVAATFEAGVALVVYGSVQDLSKPGFAGYGLLIAAAVLGWIVSHLRRQVGIQGVLTPPAPVEEIAPTGPPPDLFARKLAFNSKQFGELALFVLVVPFLVCNALGPVLMESARSYWIFPVLIPLISLVAILTGHAARRRLTEGDPAEARGWAMRGLVLGYVTLVASSALLAERFVL